MLEVRPARPDERLEVLRILEGALLEVDVEVLDRAIDADDALVAVEDERVLGAAVLLVRGERTRAARIEAIATAPRQRRRGVGSALIDAAIERVEGRADRLVAEFDPRARPFYEACGFRIESIEKERLQGVVAFDSP